MQAPQPRLEEVFAVRIMGIQFTPDWIPLDFQPFNQTFSLNGGTAYGRSGKGGLRGASFTECRTRLGSSRDMQMDVDDALRLILS